MPWPLACNSLVATVGRSNSHLRCMNPYNSWEINGWFIFPITEGYEVALEGTTWQTSEVGTVVTCGRDLNTLICKLV